MAPELQAAAERIFREGFRAGSRATGNYAVAENTAYEAWRAQQPGFRPLPRPTRQERALEAPYTPAVDIAEVDIYAAMAAVVTTGIDVVSDPTPSSDTSWGGSDFSGGGEGSGGGAGASGDW